MLFVAPGDPVHHRLRHELGEGLDVYTITIYRLLLLLSILLLLLLYTKYNIYHI